MNASAGKPIERRIHICVLALHCMSVPPLKFLDPPLRGIEIARRTAGEGAENWGKGMKRDARSLAGVSGGG